MRLFTAVDLPPDLVARLERLIEQLRPAARVKWSPPENLHITTKFIGEWPEAQLEELHRALAGLQARPPIPIRVRNLGFFPNQRSPRVFWAGVEGGDKLAGLAADTDRALSPLGVEPENRPFSPHLTLARIKEPVPMQALHDAVGALPSREFGDYIADRFYLYQSRLNPKGSVYVRVGEFPFLMR
jgi:2'-5' RNA ligase